MKGYKDNIEKQTEDNTDFRRVVYTGHNMQLVLMSIEPGDEIGAEVHDDVDQFFRIEAGEGEITVDDNVYRVKADDAVIVPQGARHNVKSVGKEPLKLYTIYSPPNHRDGVVHHTRIDADADSEQFNGVTTETRREIVAPVHG